MRSILGRNASGLFWMMRYLERMENTSRLVEAGFRMSLTRARSKRSEWESVLSTASAKDAYLSKYDDFETDHVVDFLIMDRDYPGSVCASLSAARSNARMTRTALTRDSWEAINEGWLQLSKAISDYQGLQELPELLGKTRRTGSLVSGTLASTQLRNGIYSFIELGRWLERADNTVRILDTKYYILLPSSVSVGSSLDHIQWEMILRSASAERAFQWLKGGEMTASDIVHFLVHDPRLPRSLVFCYENIVRTLSELPSPAEDIDVAPLQTAREILTHLKNSSSELIIGSGLHEFLLDMIERNARLSNEIETAYRFND